MANVQGKFYTSETQRRGVTPSSPPNAEDDPQDPVSPSSPVSFITLTDTPSSYSGQTLKGVRVNSAETGLEFYTISSGGLPPIDGSYASQALMIADQANQTAQYIYFDNTEYWEYLGTTTPSIADYRAISSGGGGGTDTNAVHYNASDGKNATEKRQARDNIGSPEGITTTLNLTGATVNNYAKTSNIIELTGSTNTNFSGIVAGTDGEKVLVINRMSSGVASFLDESGSSTAANRFSLGAIYAPEIGEGLLLRYDGTAQRWVFDDYFYIDYLKNRAGQQINPSTASTYLLNLESDNGVQGLINLKHLKATANKVFLFGRDFDGTVLYDFREVHALVPSSIIQTKAALTVENQRNFRDTTNSTAGAINNLALPDRTYHILRLAGSAADLTGIVTPGTNIFVRISINNQSGGNITIRHESASSTAANRFLIIGGADLIVPDDGWCDFQRSRNARWELVSKNF